MEDRKVFVLNWMVRVSLTEKAIFEPRIEESGWGKRIQVRKNSQCQGPVVGTCLVQTPQEKSK